jgi:tRNA(Ile)-lysidine synthase
VGPHPAVAEVRRAVRGALVAAQGRPVLLACSGGADSLALAAATAFEAPRAGLRAGLVTVDHRLQLGSEQQAERVAAVAYELGFDPVIMLAVDVGRAGGPEAAARTARYAALAASASALGAAVLLGHTLDDQAETVLLGLGRGSGPRSIAGMRPVTLDVDGTLWLRPLLAVRRTVTEAACAGLGLQPWYDPHNSDPSYQRVRLRTQVLPLLEDVLQGGVAEALARTAALLHDDLDALDELAARYLPATPPGPAVRPGAATPPGPAVVPPLDVLGLGELPRAIRTRVLRAWARSGGAAALDAVHVAALDALVTAWHGQGPIDLPGGLRVSRGSGKLEVTTPVTAAQESSAGVEL